VKGKVARWKHLVAAESEINALFETGLELVERIARRISREMGGRLALDELLSFGREGLLDAARRFDAERGVPFRGYASIRIRGAIIDGVRSNARLPRRAHERLNGLAASNRVSEGAAEDALAPESPSSSAQEAERRLNEHLAAMATALAVGMLAPVAFDEDGERTSLEPSESPEEALGRAELMALVQRSIGDLPHEERELVRRHYLEGERFDLVAKELGLSKSWASRLHTRAIQRLTKRLRGAP
jgi:RNA polymerase sigma factor for flagellar operon FliA